MATTTFDAFCTDAVINRARNRLAEGNGAVGSSDRSCVFLETVKVQCIH